MLSILICTFLLFQMTSSSLLSLVESVFTSSKTSLNSTTEKNLSVASVFDRNFTQICEENGYTAEEHTVVTDDGYILSLFRIPGTTNNTIGAPVILTHGALLNADSWIISGKNYSVGFQLVDEGYDVWFVNTRGCRYGRKHVTYDPDSDDAFWEFSYDEMARYDVTKWIDYILNVTEYDTLSYVGYSQGTAIFYALGAYNASYYDKVNVMMSLASVTFLTHTKSPILRLASSQWKIINAFWDLTETQELFRRGTSTNELLEFLCSSVLLSQIPCRSILYLMVGFDPTDLRDELLPVIYKQFPDGMSRRNVIHLAQGVWNKNFQRYNFGDKENLKVYGSSTTPQYNLTLVTTPVAVFMGLNDWMSDPKDADSLVEYLPNLIEKYVVPLKLWNHVDYFWHTNATELIGDKILTILNNYTNL